VSEVIKVFLSYASEDEKYMKELNKHFTAWRNDKEITTWIDREILPAQVWDEEIINKLRESNVIIMLLSVDFFNSQYIKNTEFSIALERLDKKEALAIGVVIGACNWEKTDIEKFQILPEKGNPIALQDRQKRNVTYKQVVNNVIAAVENFQNTATKAVSAPELGSNSESVPPNICAYEKEVSTYNIPLPYQQTTEINEKFFVDAMPHFAKQLYFFANLSIKNIDEHRKSYEKHLENTSSISNAGKLQQFLQFLCREVNSVFFTWGGVRTHFRYLHIDKKQYLKFAAALSGEYDYDYAMTPMPSDEVCMISKAVEHRTPLIYSINKDWHYGPDPANRVFKDYVTFVLMDHAFLHDGKYLLSMGISFENPDLHRNLYYILTLSRFDDIIADIVKSFANALDINIVDTILESRNLIEEGFYPKKQ